MDSARMQRPGAFREGRGARRRCPAASGRRPARPIRGHAIRDLVIPGLVILAASGACSDQADPGAPWVVEDSAGVTVVTTPASHLETLPRWTLGSKPALDLGTVTGGGVTEFYDVADVRLIPGDRLVVANRGSEELRFFSLEGEHLHTAGRPGNGPREFKGLAMVRSRADSLVTYDSGNDRFSVRGPWGEYGRSFRLEWFSGLLVPEDVAGGLRILAITGRHMTELAGSGLLVDTALVSFYDMEGKLLDSVARLPHNVRFVSRSGDWQTTLGAPLVAWAALTATREGFCHAFGPEVEVRCFDARGGLRLIGRVAVPPRAVTDGDKDAYWERMRTLSSPERWSRFRSLRDQLPFPSAHSAFDALQEDDQGVIWARRYQPPESGPEEWWLFREGRLVAGVQAPERFRLTHVQGGRVAGVWRDDLGVEHVRVYALIRDAVG